MVAMIKKLTRASVRGLWVIAVLYVTFFVHVGSFTLFDHAARIFSTQEAHEFANSVFGAFRHMGQALSSRVKQELTPAPEPSPQ
jgi:hypothetical protein